MINIDSDDKGVSPVIGVILMVAVTVALVALVTVVVFDTGSNVSESPDATVDIQYDNSIAEATIIRNENVDEFKIRNADTGAKTNIDGIGSTGSIGVSEGDEVQVIGVMDDGSEEVITDSSATNINEESGPFDGSSTIDLEGNELKGGLIVSNTAVPSEVDNADYRFIEGNGDTYVCPTDDSNEQNTPSTANCNEDVVNNDKYNSDVQPPNPSLGTRFIVDETGDHTIQISKKDSNGNLIDVDFVEIDVVDSG